MKALRAGSIAELWGSALLQLGLVSGASTNKVSESAALAADSNQLVSGKSATTLEILT